MTPPPAPPAADPPLLARATLDRDLATWLGLFVAALLTMGVGTPPTAIVSTLIACVATLILTLRWHLPGLAVVVLVVAGVGLRVLAPYGGFSDVLQVVQAAVRLALAGGNPYGHGYAESFPPGAPYAYGPVALAWYAPAVDHIRTFELVVSCAMVVVLGLRGRIVGLAIYAVLAPLLVTSGDGSNDTSAGILLLLALLVAVRSPIWGGFLIAIAAGFKPYAAAWLPPLLAYGGLVWPLIAFVAGSLLAWGVAALWWHPTPILESFRKADAVHATPYYSLGWILGGANLMPEWAWQAFRLVLGAIVAVIGYFQVHTARSFIVTGAVIYLITLYTGWWSTFAYLAAMAPVICWHLDDWMGLGDQRARLPGDPVGRLTARVDARWPVLHPQSDGPLQSALHRT
ncbi:MAG: hypothetical protein U0869_24065 [Chloroflexota bacterium]